MRRLIFFIMLGIVASFILWRQAEIRPAPVPVDSGYGPTYVIHRTHDGRIIDVDEGRGRRFSVHPPAAPPPPALAWDEKIEVDDIPVAIIPGTRVTQAEMKPPKPPVPPRSSADGSKRRAAVHRAAIKKEHNDAGMRSVLGRLSATEDRACDDARLQLEHAISEWLVPEVPSSWKPPKSMVNAVALAIEVKPVEKELGTLYEATIRADLSPERRAQFVNAYHHQLVAHRLTLIGGILAFVLSCLAALAGYIKADEATKGYYTNRLRIASAAGVGAAGVLIYQLLS